MTKAKKKAPSPLKRRASSQGITLKEVNKGIPIPVQKFEAPRNDKFRVFIITFVFILGVAFVVAWLTLK
jgi:hypothetical protein